MFKKTPTTQPAAAAPVERVTSVLGSGITWQGSLRGSGGVRIEGTFDGEIAVRGLVVVGESGRVNCEDLRANTVIVAGAVRGNMVGASKAPADVRHSAKWPTHRLTDTVQERCTGAFWPRRDRRTRIQLSPIAPSVG